MSDPISQVFELLQKKGRGDYIGERITQIEHMIQAAMLAQERIKKRGELFLDINQANSLIVACLLHDVGNLLDILQMKANNINIGGKDHEIAGADYLRHLGFNELVCDLVSNHVNAKRYLVATSNDYQLSEASAETLKHQGGPMTMEETEKFKSSAHFKLYLEMRTIDESAKRTDMKLKELEFFREICSKCLVT